MWSFHVGYARKVARETQRKRIEQKQKPQFCLKRITVAVKSTEFLDEEPIVIEGRIVLNDFRPESISFFSTQPLYPGQHVAVTFETPAQIYLKGIVEFCRHVNINSRILSQQPFPYRIHVSLDFASELEKKNIKLVSQKMLEYTMQKNPSDDLFESMPGAETK